jgi:hypothetical protein
MEKTLRQIQGDNPTEKTMKGDDSRFSGFGFTSLHVFKRHGTIPRGREKTLRKNKKV